MSDTTALFVTISRHRMMDQYLPKLVHAIGKIGEERLWLHEALHLNSIGGVVLHICEHVKRNTLRYKNQSALLEAKGIENHFPDLHTSPERLIITVEETFQDWNAVLQKRGGFQSEIEIHRLYHLVEHISYHLGQIVDRVQRLTGTRFQFCQNGLNERNLKALIDHSQKREQQGIL